MASLFYFFVSTLGAPCYGFVHESGTYTRRAEEVSENVMHMHSANACVTRVHTPRQSAAGLHCLGQVVRSPKQTCPWHDLLERLPTQFVQKYRRCTPSIRRKHGNFVRHVRHARKYADSACVHTHFLSPYPRRRQPHAWQKTTFSPAALARDSNSGVLLMRLHGAGGPKCGYHVMPPSLFEPRATAAACHC